LKLNGSFDGTSACELVNLLNNGKLGDSAKILVDTDALKDVHPFGVDVLHNRLQLVKAELPPLVFTGKQSAQFSL
jgi:hypothetical protein